MRILLSTGLILLSVYLAVCALVFFFQNRLLYFPSTGLGTTPAAAGMAFESVRLRTEDGEQIAGWFVPAPAERGALLFFHGNAGNRSDRVESIHQFHQLGLSVFIIDYRGYGGSSGTPSETGTYRDASSAWEYLINERNYAANEIVIFGRSLGGGIAAWLANEVVPGALILESTFTSVPDLGSQIYPFLPVRLLSRTAYDNLGIISGIQCPVMVIHSRDDEIIPYKHGERLFEAAPEPKSFMALQYGHNESSLRAGPKYSEGIASFLDSHLK